MEKEVYDNKRSIHVMSSSFNNDCTAGTVPIVLATSLPSSSSSSSEHNELSILTNTNNINSIYSNVLNNLNSNNQSNYYNNNNNNKINSTNPVYYQQLMENKIKANLGMYNSGQSYSNNIDDVSPKTASVSVSSSNGSIDSPPPPKSSSNHSYTIANHHNHNKDTSPVTSSSSSTNYPDYSNQPDHSQHQQQQQQHQQLQKESNPTKKIKSTFPFGKCRVCNDKATGIHYGIATCEGCKGFFKRSTLKKEKYRCYFGNNCLLTPKNRNRCKACRFNKCLDVGMSIQGVKMGRIPKIEKEKALLSLKLNGDEDGNGNIKHRINQNGVNHYDDEEEDEGSNEENNDFDNDYDADDGEDDHHLNNTHDHEEMTRAFAKTSVLGDPNGDFNYNVQMLIAKNNRILSNANLKSHEPDHHMVKKIRNNESVVYVSSSPQTHQLQHAQKQPQTQSEHQKLISQNISHPQPIVNLDRSGNRQTQTNSNDIILLENLSLSTSNQQQNNSKIESDEISQSSDTNNSESDVNETRVSLRIRKYDEEIELDKELINFTPGYKHISIYELLKMHKPLRSANIIANCYHSNYTNNKLDDSYQIISSLLSDKIYQIHIEHNDKVVKLQERAIRLLYQGVQEFEGFDATIKEVWEGLLESIPQVVKNLIAFAREIPGLNELSQVDFNLIINNKVFDFFILRHAPLFINGESFMVLPNNIQYTRKWMNQVIGQEMTDDLFNFSTRFNKLGLTTKEMALLYPFVLTGNIYGTFQDVATVQNLNEYYHRALLYEFDLNLRDDDFIRRVNELISELPKLNELQAARIGSLSPQC